VLVVQLQLMVLTLYFLALHQLVVVKAAVRKVQELQVLLVVLAVAAAAAAQVAQQLQVDKETQAAAVKEIMVLLVVQAAAEQVLLARLL
jgi:hypothetical protein